MARVTVEDCLDNVDNRFQLVLLGAKRARQLARGAEAHLAWENDKPTVVALREIAEGHVDASLLDEPIEDPLQIFLDASDAAGEGEGEGGQAATDEAPAADGAETRKDEGEPDAS